MSDRPVVTDTTNVRQIKDVRRAAKHTREQELDDLRRVLRTPEGQRVFWRVLAHCRVFHSIFTTSASIYYNAGQQDIGHFLLAEISAADPAIFPQLVRDHLSPEDVTP